MNKKVELLKMNTDKWNWNIFLDYAVKGHELTHEIMSDATSESASWKTCAVGKLCDVLPTRSGSEQPLDEIASTLGFRFHGQIQMGYYDQAQKTMEEIEARTIYLLSQPNYIDSNED
jgi:hypothetical protein